MYRLQTDKCHDHTSALLHASGRGCVGTGRKEYSDFEVRSIKRLLSGPDGDSRHPEDSLYRGKYEFVRMPFGVRNAPAVFQALMTRLFSECKEFCSPHMDDLVTYSRTWEEHRKHVKEVLSRLKSAGLTANPAKCVWGGQTMEFLGHHVGNGCMSILSKRLETLTHYTKPMTKRGLRSFLGAISFYRLYIKLLASQKAVLSPSTSKLAPSKVLRTGEMESAFH